MAYESEVRQQAVVLADFSGNAKRERNKVGTLVGGTNQWWKGEGGKAFASEYQNIDRDMEYVFRCIDSAVEGLNRLPALIRRAERERREQERKSKKQ